MLTHLQVTFPLILTIIITKANGAPPFIIDNGLTSSISNEIYSSSENSDESDERLSFDEYLKIRTNVINKQFASSFENGVSLTEREQLVNKIIMDLKSEEIQRGLITPSNFTPSRHIFEVMGQIAQSKLFQLIKKMPKGAVLHAHDTAMCKTEYVVSLTYRDNLWQCNDTHSHKGALEFKFSARKPTNKPECQWELVADVRIRQGPENYDKYLSSLFTLFTDDPHHDYFDINAVWTRFSQIFRLIEPIVTYAPVWKDYYKEALKENYADGVQYLEFRGVLPEVYELDGKTYDPIEVTQMYIDVLTEYKSENPDFIGSKLIYAPWRLVPNQTIEKYIDTIIELHDKYPDFVAGYDFVGQEDLGRRLIDFVPYLLKLPSDINSFFHAGETNWFGETDENLIDAILLGAKRIGHGFALAKHPTLLQMVKERNIVVEINPVSNQVLKLVDDYRNHPGSLFFAENIPLVVSSDDYSFWETTPLSHDFYQAFLGIASSHSDLRTLKKLAMNSLKYSSLNRQEKRIAFAKWKPKWDQFIENTISDNY